MKEVINYQGVNFIRYPNSKNSSDRKYFKGWWRCNGKRVKEYLHRAIWITHHGEIPKGYHVHHDDENPLNNDISNLVLQHGKAHLQNHYANSSDDYKQIRITALLNKAIPASKEWHSTTDGNDHHKQLAQKTLFVNPVNRECIECSNQFTQTHISNTKYCCHACKNRYNSRKTRQKKRQHKSLM